MLYWRKLLAWCAIMITRGKRPETLAYIAGIVDGEGSVNLYGDKAAFHYAPRVSVYNSSLPLMEFLQKEFPEGTISVMRAGNEEHPKTVYHWYIGYRNVVPFLTEILPYLLVKKRQAILLLAYVRTMPEGRGLAAMVSPKIAKVRQRLFAEMKVLNYKRSHPQRLSETASRPDEAIVCSALKDAEGSRTEMTAPA